MIGILDLCFGKGRAAVDAPVNGLLTLVNKSTFDELSKRARNRRLIAEVHRQIKMIPVAEHAEPLKFNAHDVDEPRRIITTRTAEVSYGHVALFGSEFAIDLELNR